MPTVRKALHSRTTQFVKFCPEIARGLKSNNAALLLSLLSDIDAEVKTKSREFYHEAEKLKSKLNLGDYEFRAARDTLRDAGLITWRRKGMDPKIWYRINHEALTEFLLVISTDLFAQDNDPDEAGADAPLGIVGNQQCALWETNSGQCGKPTVELISDSTTSDPTTSDPPQPPKGVRASRTWDVVCEELCASMPHHSETLKLWCEYKRQRRHSPYAEVTVAKWRNWYSDFTPQRLSEEVDRAIAAGWDGIHPKTPTPQFRTPPSQPQRMSKQEQDDRLKYLEEAGAI